jgi:hypothetical protein
LRRCAPGAGARHRERHVGGLRVDRELAEQAQQIRVGAIVVHEETRVEPHRSVGAVDRHRVRVPAQARLALEQVDLMTTAEEVRGRKAGHAGADHGDPLHAGVRYTLGGRAVSMDCP